MPSVALDTSAFPKQDYVTINGLQSPGRATIRSASTPRNWDKRKGYATSSAWLVFMGNDLCEFEIDIYLWDEDNDPQAWADFANGCLKKTGPGKAGVAVTISHPILSWPPLEITQCVIKNVTQPEQDDNGGWAITISCIEYAGAPKAVVPKVTPTPPAPFSSPTAAISGGSQIASLTAQRDSLYR